MVVPLFNTSLFCHVELNPVFYVFITKQLQLRSTIKSKLRAAGWNNKIKDIQHMQPRIALCLPYSLVEGLNCHISRSFAISWLENMNSISNLAGSRVKYVLFHKSFGIWVISLKLWGWSFESAPSGALFCSVYSFLCPIKWEKKCVQAPFLENGQLADLNSAPHTWLILKCPQSYLGLSAGAPLQTSNVGYRQAKTPKKPCLS